MVLTYVHLRVVWVYVRRIWLLPIAYTVRHSLFEILFVSFCGKKASLYRKVWDRSGAGKRAVGFAPVPKTKRQRPSSPCPSFSRSKQQSHRPFQTTQSVFLPSLAVACRRLLLNKAEIIRPSIRQLQGNLSVRSFVRSFALSLIWSWPIRLVPALKTQQALGFENRKASGRRS